MMTILDTEPADSAALDMFDLDIQLTSRDELRTSQQPCSTIPACTTPTSADTLPHVCG
ncbi:FDLD family class I lanthipeptide [Streptomyces rimosus]|uniref:FDLD family class I lanthipeptide n=1 Tax=Streptomyces rimosus TaxID=1927 RepID=UPI000AF5EDAD|nr:FDLD family class I lanthipeptide [Streptomyces rimosus]